MIKRITALLCTFACAFLMLAPVFSRKTSSCDVVASAQVYDESTRTFTIALPTYNNSVVSVPMSTEYRKPMPLVAIVGNGTLSLAPSLDGFTPYINDESDVVNISTNSYLYTYSALFQTQDFTGQEERDDIYVLAYSSAFNNIPNDYYPSTLACHILYGITAQTECVQFEFYVTYANADGETLQGAGFSLRVPTNEYYNYITPFARYTGDGQPTNRYNVYRTNDVLGWSYSSAVDFVGAYDNGYNQGRAYGETIGYNKGYTDGVANANEYTFKGLISSVIDVPINAFRSLFNFNILGFNMANFFLSLLTLGAVLAIVRLIL